jgi:hypothetical protein
MSERCQQETHALHHYSRDTEPRRCVFFSICGHNEDDRLAAVSPKSDRVF